MRAGRRGMFPRVTGGADSDIDVKNLDNGYQGLEFLFFDLSACLLPDDDTPVPPPPVQ